MVKVIEGGDEEEINLRLPDHLSNRVAYLCRLVAVVDDGWKHYIRHPDGNFYFAGPCKDLEHSSGHHPEYRLGHD